VAFFNCGNKQTNHNNRKPQIKKEAAELAAEKDKLPHDYKGLKEGVRQIGLAQRSVEHILDNIEKMEQPQQQRRCDMER